ncbi:hypothetical protein CBL_12439 [Carabus blaptoides fortunei]
MVHAEVSLRPKTNKLDRLLLSTEQTSQPANTAIFHIPLLMFCGYLVRGEYYAHRAEGRKEGCVQVGVWCGREQSAKPTAYIRPFISSKSRTFRRLQEGLSGPLYHASS